uniref:Uncharacterized protein n=1 Tax=Knipowitschia caucasica TaxID=637954 RepID=A0AAV2JST3_KNICA
MERATSLPTAGGRSEAHVHKGCSCCDHTALGKKQNQVCGLGRYQDLAKPFQGVMDARVHGEGPCARSQWERRVARAFGLADSTRALIGQSESAGLHEPLACDLRI